MFLLASIAQGANITHISGGLYHTLLLNQDGRVWACGLNLNGQLGIGSYSNVPHLVQVSNLTDVVEINGGNNCSTAVKSDGTLWTWGLNDRGQLGIGNNTDTNLPTQVNLTNVRKTANGVSHALAVVSDGTVWSWGFITLFRSRRIRQRRKGGKAWFTKPKAWRRGLLVYGQKPVLIDLFIGFSAMPDIHRHHGIQRGF